MKAKGPSWKKIKRHSMLVESREYDRGPELWEDERKCYSFEMTCPFCGEQEVAYALSLAANGKRCECGALFAAGGTAYHWKRRPGMHLEEEGNTE